jgi:predicted dehydrogenase
VDLATKDQEKTQRFSEDPQSYVWEQGASLVAESLVTKTEPLVQPEHALHVLEIMEAATASGKTGKRIELVSTFRWPVTKA